MTRLARLASTLLRVVGAIAALVVLGALLVGVPWGLITFIGWPLPGHVPTLDEIEATLLNPLSVTLLLNLLACIAWPIWLVFAVDVVRCVPDVLRGMRPPAIGPVHAVAAVLVAAALLGLAQPRASAGNMPPPEQPVATVTSSPTAYPLRTTGESAAPKQTADETEAGDAEAIVRPPRDGVHDSLWRVAQRELGDGQRWVELFRLNEGRPQPDGGVLTDPHMVRPYWVIRLPAEPQTAPGRPPPSTTPDPSPEPAPIRPDVDSERQGEQAPAPHAVSETPGTAVALWSGGIVATTLAGAVALAMVIRRRKRLRFYEPGSGDRAPPPTPAPAVHELHLAYDEVQLNEPPGTDEPISLTDEGSLRGSRGQGPAGGDDHTAVAVGVDDEHTRALDLAAARGLGLTGAGAEAAARSLLVHLVGTTSASVVVTADVARALLGDELRTSARLDVADDLASAVAQVENRCGPDSPAPVGTTLNTVVVAATTTTANARLQSVLDTGADRGIGGILLGHWPAGATVRVRSDGTVAAASPSLDNLRGSRLFHLDATDTRDLLALFADAPAASTASPDPGVQLEDAQGSTSSSTTGAPDETSEESGDGPASRRQGLEATTDEDGELHDVEPMAPENGSDPPIEDHTSVEREYELSILGPVTLTWHGTGDSAVDLTSTLAPKHRALLVFLALHPQGTTREVIREALWPHARGRRPFNAFYASLSQVRKALTHATGDTAADVITHEGEHVSLNPDVVEVDYWQLHEAEHQRHTSTSEEDRVDAWSRIAAAYRGEIADGMSALWLEGPREAAHRAVVDALAGMAAHYRDADPPRQLQLLEHARLLNPENEAIYRDIMRVQAQLGYIDAISRTVQLLTTALGEIGERPDPNTLTLARALQTRHQGAAS